MAPQQNLPHNNSMCEAMLVVLTVSLGELCSSHYAMLLCFLLPAIMLGI